MGNPSPPPGAAADERRSPAKRFDRNTRQEDERARGKGHGQGRGANQERKDPKRTFKAVASPRAERGLYASTNLNELGCLALVLSLDLATIGVSSSESTKARFDLGVWRNDRREFLHSPKSIRTSR